MDHLGSANRDMKLIVRSFHQDSIVHLRDLHLLRCSVDDCGNYDKTE
jgi:hypothetical protein